MAYGDHPGFLIPDFSNRPGPESDLSVAHIDQTSEVLRDFWTISNAAQRKIIEGFEMGGLVRPVPPMATFDPEPDFSCNGVDTDPGCPPMDARDKLLSLVRALGLMLSDYGTDDQLEIVKRFSDPEFRKAYRLEKSGAAEAVAALDARSARSRSFSAPCNCYSCVEMFGRALPAAEEEPDLMLAIRDIARST